MATAAKQQIETGKFRFSSSVAADVWHPKPSREAFEWWYFDAISDDGRDVIVVIFLDNFIFSPRYNANQKSEDRSQKSGENPKSKIQSFDSKIENRKSKIQNQDSFPAVAFFYYRDGKPVYRAINEFPAASFSAGLEKPECRIGDNSFRFEAAPYGSGYVLSVNTDLKKDRRLQAEFEWLSIESDFTPEKPLPSCEAHCWNLVATRSDVSGKINVSDENGKLIDNRQFRGTGYHDHNYDNRWLPETVSDWQWGRAHFADATAVFYRYREIGEPDATTKLFVVRKGELRERDAIYEEQKLLRNVFGIKYPKRLRFVSDDNIRLRVKQTKVIDQSFFYLRFLSEMTLTLRDGKPRKAVGITEYLAPKTLKYRWLDWLVNMRIGKNGKGALLK